MEKRKAVPKMKLPDLSKPIDKDKVEKPEVSCFGKEWDITTRECSICAANEVCAILTQESTKKVVQELETKEGGFLDQQDFSFDKKGLIDYVQRNSGKLSSQQLVEKVFELSNSRDTVAVVEYVKRLVKETEGMSIREKIVYYE